MKVLSAVMLVLASAASHGFVEPEALERDPTEAWGLEEADPWDSLMEIGVEVQRAFQHAMGSEVRNELTESVDTAVRFGMSLLSEARDTSESMWEQISEQTERLASQLEDEMSRRVVAIESHAEAYTLEVRRKIDQNLLEIQLNTIPVVHTFHGQLAQTALNIHKSTESFIRGFASLWGGPASKDD
ncbi:hypothetical protein AALO_G00253610 [Alosa alosa]|uniref:Uncharacterized protein n=1 Tax=Alosa alosa TaxID=278164 RepID=A0AAV6FRQ3_9TELE|nr:hypothetical protein AALO_G00253610 [Alosa alosa]